DGGGSGGGEVVRAHEAGPERGRPGAGGGGSGDDPEVHQPVVLAVAGSVRRGDLVERGGFLCGGAGGGGAGGGVRGTTRGVGVVPDGGDQGRRDGGGGYSAQERHERGPAGWIRRRLSARGRQMEPDDREVGADGGRAPAAEPALSPADWHLRGDVVRHGRQ